MRVLVVFFLTLGLCVAAEGHSHSEAKGDDSIIFMPERMEGHYADDLRAITKPIVYENGVLFTFEAKSNDVVCISGDFFKWNKRLKMSVNRHGIFYAFVKMELPAGLYKYRYYVNQFWVNDPQQTLSIPDEFGDRITTMRLTQDLFDFELSPKKLADNRFLFFLKDNGYKMVNWVGTKNRWDAFVTPMALSNGYWQVRLSLGAEEPYYQFCINQDTKILDPANHHDARLKFGERVSVVNFASSEERH